MHVMGWGDDWWWSIDEGWIKQFLAFLGAIWRFSVWLPGMSLGSNLELKNHDTGEIGRSQVE